MNHCRRRQSIMLTLLPNYANTIYSSLLNIHLFYIKNNILLFNYSYLTIDNNTKLYNFTFAMDY